VEMGVNYTSTQQDRHRSQHARRPSRRTLMWDAVTAVIVVALIATGVYLVSRPAAVTHPAPHHTIGVLG
jgi:hypothetical protein